MPSTPPPGDPAPRDGSLPVPVRAPFAVYVHVPYCAHRCGYCDFNTYLDTDGSAARYVDAALAEARLAARVLGDGRPPVDTVFVGGGTPTLLPATDLARLLHGLDEILGLDPRAEVTTEANPETLDRAYLDTIRAAGYTRLSVGMQSAAPHVLSTLERRHTPGRAAEVIAEAKRAGFERTSLDLIYGTPGESDDDWRRSVEAALEADPGHLSAYALVVEEGTPLAGKVARGETSPPDDDVAADRYETADDLLEAAGYEWYEISNWARPGHECRHNLHYWRSHDWWGIGPGAHSHVGGVRWWNVRLPREHAEAVHAGISPAQAREVLDEDTRRYERLMLGIRLRDGLPHDQAGRLDPELATVRGDRVVLTRKGRLLADMVATSLDGTAAAAG